MIRPASPDPTSARPPRARGVVTALLGVPLFWKLLWAGVAVSAGTLVFALWMAGRDPAGLSPTGFLLLLAGLTLGTALVQALVLRVALSPLAMLEATAERVRGGDLGARAPTSRIEDAHLRRLRTSFNGMLDEMETARRQQERIARDTLGAEEDERDRIARELYGEPAQALAGLLVRLRILVRTNPEISGAAHELEEGIRDALEEVRRLARRLRPPELDELGIRAALSAHIRSLTVPRELEPRLDGDVPDERLSPEVSLTLFRICQAAITRSVSREPVEDHNLVIRFVSRGDRVVVDIHCPPTPRGPGSDEFDAWAERVRWSGGRLTRRTGRGAGQRLRLTLPLTSTDDIATPHSSSTRSTR